MLRSFKILPILLSIAAFACFSALVPAKEAKRQNSETITDSLVHFAKNYVNYMDNLGAKGAWFKKVYVKQTGHERYKLWPHTDHWPDSLEETVNVIYYKNEPVVYAEIPLGSAGDTYQETDCYFYKGKLIACKQIFTDFKSNCTTHQGLLNERTMIWFDSTGTQLRKDFKALDVDNKPVNTANCSTGPEPRLYRTFKETPLGKER